MLQLSSVLWSLTRRKSEVLLYVGVCLVNIVGALNIIVLNLDLLNFCKFGITINLYVLIILVIFLGQKVKLDACICNAAFYMLLTSEQ